MFFEYLCRRILKQIPNLVQTEYVDYEENVDVCICRMSVGNSIRTGKIRAGEAQQ
jgi:hypothetical protein